MSEQHLLAYYRWADLTHWKLDSMDRWRAGRPVLAYVNYNDALWNRYAKKGNVVWVVGLGPGRMPTLEARITVARRYRQLDPDPPHGKRRWGFRVEGDGCGSAFFGLNHAAPNIMRLAFANATGCWSLRERRDTARWTSLHGRHLRASRRIAAPGDMTGGGYRSPGIRPLEQLENRASVFISWKHMDHDENRASFLRDLAVRLAKRGFAVWMDKVALGDAEQVAERADSRKAMMRLLRQGLEGCKVVVGVWTEHYGERSTRRGENWTKREWEDRERAKRLALYPGRRFKPKASLRDPDARVPMPLVPSRADVRMVADRVEAKLLTLVDTGA